MGNNSPDISRDTFNSANKYDKVIVQQGKPLPDSDLNEIQDCIVTELLRYLQVVEGTILIPRSNDFQYGFEPIPIAGVLDDFTIRGGGAIVEGALVTTPGLEDILYSSLDNYLLKGVVTGVGTTSIQDENKMFQDSHYLPTCRVLMTSGAQAGITYTISSRTSNIEVALTATPTGVAVGDTYIILPPAMPSSYPSGGIVYLNLMVFWTELNSEEDPSIINPDLGVETSQRRQRRFCMRVDSAPLSLTDPNITFATRISTVGTISVPSGSTELDSSMIELTMSVRDFSFEASNGVVAEMCIIPFDLASGTRVTLPDEFNTDDPAYGVIPVQYYAGPVFNDYAYTWEKYFRFMGGDDGSGLATGDSVLFFRPLTGNSGYPIEAFGLYVDSVQIWDTDTVVDAHGFLPEGTIEIELGFGGNSIHTHEGRVHLICFRKKLRALRTKDAIAPEALPNVLFDHTTSDKVRVPVLGGVTGTGDVTDDLTDPANLNSLLQVVMSRLRGRIPKQADPEGGPSGWTPIWVSHRSAFVSSGQVGIYYKNGEFAITTNCAIDGSGTVGVFDDTEPLMVTHWASRLNTMRCQSPSGKTFSITSPANWDVFNVAGGTDLSINRLISSVMNGYYENWLYVSTNWDTNSIRRPTGFGAALKENLDATDSSFSAFYGALGLTMANAAAGGINKLFPYVFDVNGLSWSNDGNGNYEATCDIKIPGVYYRQEAADMACFGAFILSRDALSYYSYGNSCHVSLRDYNSGGYGSQLAIKQIKVPQPIYTSYWWKLIVWISLEGDVAYPDE